MLSVAISAAANSAVHSASKSVRPWSRYSHSEAAVAIAKNMAALSGWANVPFARRVPEMSMPVCDANW